LLVDSVESMTMHGLANPKCVQLQTTRTSCVIRSLPEDGLLGNMSEN